VSQAGLDPSELVFIDETWARTNMTRLRGRAPVGERLVDKVPHGHWTATTLIAALDHRGIRCATVVGGAVNGDVFAAFVEQVLAPTLSPGDVVVMDNLSSHKGERVRQLIEARGATRALLPPYSPDLNPIELAFAKLKQLMRSAGHRTVAALWGDVQRMLDRVTANDATGFMRHCGYPLQVG
jgi:transposase